MTLKSHQPSSAASLLPPVSSLKRLLGPPCVLNQTFKVLREESTVVCFYFIIFKGEFLTLAFAREASVCSHFLKSPSFSGLPRRALERTGIEAQHRADPIWPSQGDKQHTPFEPFWFFFPCRKQAFPIPTDRR